MLWQVLELADLVVLCFHHLVDLTSFEELLHKFQLGSRLFVEFALFVDEQGVSVFKCVFGAAVELLGDL